MIRKSIPPGSSSVPQGWSSKDKYKTGINRDHLKFSR
jgi:hypothetical protein